MTKSSAYWPAPVGPATLNSKVALPGSKSQTNRALILGSVAQSETTVIGALASRDSLLACEALKKLGAKFRFPSPDELVVTPAPVIVNSGTIDCGLAGTVMRFLPALSAFGNGKVTFTGDDGAKTRPISSLLDALSEIGADIEYIEVPGQLPFSITGIGGSAKATAAQFPVGINLDSSASSQFLSALMLAAPMAPQGFNIDLVGTAPSAPHIEMTVKMLEDQKVPVTQVSDTSYVISNLRPVGNSIDIEPDLSNAGPFLAAAVICGGEAQVLNWPLETTQAGDAWKMLLPKFGASVRLHSHALHVQGNPSREWDGVNLDLHEVGELVPTIAALCLLAKSPSELVGIGHLRGHETDRLQALATEISRCGGHAEILDDGLRIIPAELHAADFNSYHDHRMATFGALIGLAIPGCRVNNIETTSKTLPDFPQRWAAFINNESTPPIPSLGQAVSSVS